jgi:2,5-diamino-6-(ribosylamino)-4(3H)-pyrimidinone 5'-phosphate reductase
MIPKIIIHNSISLDGSLTNFDVNMNLHYQIASKFKPDAHLIGSNTIKIGFELYGDTSKEKKNDFKRPLRNENLPYWIIIDSKGSLKGLLHKVRRFNFCKDLIILISEKTPKEFITYLKDRDYDYYIIGQEHVNLKESFVILNKKYNVKNILTDCGKVLSNLLLNQGFVDELSLLIHPVIVGDNSYNIFNDINKKLKLKLLKNEILNEEYIWLYYEVK